MFLEREKRNHTHIIYTRTLYTCIIRCYISVEMGEYRRTSLLSSQVKEKEEKIAQLEEDTRKSMASGTHTRCMERSPPEFQSGGEFPMPEIIRKDRA